MLTLLIQTVFPQAGVALWDSSHKVSQSGTAQVKKDGKVREMVSAEAEKIGGEQKMLTLEWPSMKDELQTLLPNIEKLLDKGGAGWSDIGKIVIVVGVGNFSATRISVTMANMLGLLTQAELFEIKLTEEIGIEDLVKLVQSKKNWQAVKLAKPVYKTAPVISPSKKQPFKS